MPTPWLLAQLLVCIQLITCVECVNKNAKALNDSLLWGPYRPNLYFGVRPRLPQTLLTGLLWSNVEDFQTVQATFRFTCEQHQGMASYGWNEYDVRTGGLQTIQDAENQLDLTTRFVKIPGGTNGGSWAVRIQGNPRVGARPNLKTAVVFYVAKEGLGTLEIANEYDEHGYEDSVVLRGEMQQLGGFQFEITRGPETNTYPSAEHPSYNERPLDRTAVKSIQMPSEALWQGRPILFAEMKKDFDAYIKEYGEEAIPPPWQALFMKTNDADVSNMYFIQKVFEGSFEFDVVFSSASATKTLTLDDVTRAINSASSSFSSKFEEVFKATAPFNELKYNIFSKSLFSNLVGGIGYFYGDAIIDRSYAPEYDEENEGFWEDAAEARARKEQSLEGPHELFTSVPSRPFFPRGFLWDEGFHLIPILDWDIELTLDILSSWFKLVDEDGWIAREQILGPEARSKVPQEFQVQYPHYANPPTLFLVLQELVWKLEASNSFTQDQKRVYKDQLLEIYPLIKRNYFWYRKTQRGDLKSYDRSPFSSKEAYRWRGRTPRHILPSGLDDYPRAQPPHPGELHVDLISWMGMVTRALRGIAIFLAETDDIIEFAKYEEAILRNVDDLHWSSEHNAYCDATIDAYDESVFVCHKGYISLFPFITGLMPPSHPHLEAVLDLISDPEELWSDYGIRSLSKKDELYGTDENYWRSPIWMNINYMIVQNLLKVAESDGPHRTKAHAMYTELRKNLVKTVYQSWEETGYAWEQYNPTTGAGQRTQHFTGWTSLVVKIMCMPDLSKVAIPSHGEL